MMTNYEKSVLNAACLVVNRSPSGEVHGSIEALADVIACELGGPVSDGGMRRFEDFLMTRGLESITAAGPLCLFVAMNGELNLVDRRTILDE